MHVIKHDYTTKIMIREALEKVISEDLAEIWSLLSPDEKRLITDNFVIHTFKKNQIIYAEKEEPEFLWCLLKGKVKMYKDGVGGRAQILRLYRPVQYFGYRAYFAGEPYVSSVAAFEPSTLGSIPMTVVCELIRSNNGIAWFFIRDLSRNLGGSDTKSREPNPEAYPRSSCRSADSAQGQLRIRG